MIKSKIDEINGFWHGSHAVKRTMHEAIILLVEDSRKELGTPDGQEKVLRKPWPATV